MSTAARKARKRAGEKFVHPTKVPTPLLQRAQNSPRAIYGGGYGTRPTRFGLTKATERLLRSLIPAAKPEPRAELDPKPYRVGRNRYRIDEVFGAVDEKTENAIFSPRAKFEQRESQYIENA